MCVICVSKKGIRQPTETELYSMWAHNPHGAGYMSVRNNKVMIHKGFMFYDDFIRSVRSENFTEDDSVIYHFRIRTQGKTDATMTHPFPITNNPKYLTALDVICDIGIAHNGIIPITTDYKETEFSDTALFIQKYLSEIIHSPNDINNKRIQEIIGYLGKSKFALLNRSGDIAIIGTFYNDNGLLLSNQNHLISYDKQYYSFGNYDFKRSEKNVLHY